MASEVVNIRERIEKVRAEMAGEILDEKEFVKNEFISPNNESFSKQPNQSNSNLPEFKLNFQNPVSPKLLLFLILMQLLTSIALILVIFFK
tara:strand:+ start:399 stop:671 length:273 start_codon:yes stop_codon:yes gene_type:complete